MFETLLGVNFLQSTCKLGKKWKEYIPNSKSCSYYTHNEPILKSYPESISIPSAATNVRVIQTQGTCKGREYAAGTWRLKRLGDRQLLQNMAKKISMIWRGTTIGNRFENYMKSQNHTVASPFWHWMRNCLGYLRQTSGNTGYREIAMFKNMMINQG